MKVIHAHAFIEEFIDNLNDRTRAQVDKTILLLEERGASLRMPHSRSLGEGLFELRLKGDHPVRIFYMYFQREAWLLHVISKKTGAIPARELRYAQNIRDAVLRKYNI